MSIKVVEWLARFHAYSYVVMHRHIDSGKGDADSWLKKHPWIRKSNEEGVHYNHMEENLDQNGKKKFDSNGCLGLKYLFFWRRLFQHKSSQKVDVHGCKLS